MTSDPFRPFDMPRLKVMQYMATQGSIMAGMENHILTVAEHLDRALIETMITCPIEGRVELFRRAATIAVPIHSFPTGARTPTGYVKRFLSLTHVLAQQHVDILHIHACGFTGLNALLAAKLARVPAIVITHHSWYGATPRKWYGPRPHNRSGILTLQLEKYLANSVITLYAEQAQDMEAVGIPPQRVHVIPMGTNLSRFDSPTAPSSADGLFRIIIVSRMVEGKGHAELVEAVARLAPRYPQLRLLMVGDGVTRRDIEAQIERLGVTDLVEIAGYVPNDELPTLLRTAHVVALPSHFGGEVLPNTLIEGMASGLAAVGTRHRGIPDIIADKETGLLVEPHDIDGLAEAIESLVTNPARTAEMGLKGSLRAQQLFSAEKLGSSLTSIYLDVATQAGRQARVKAVAH